MNEDDEFTLPGSIEEALKLLGATEEQLQQYRRDLAREDVAEACDGTGTMPVGKENTP
jgi:hypothetical protein